MATIIEFSLPTEEFALEETLDSHPEAPGIVQVTNNSHADPDKHSYRVNVEGGAPVACECSDFDTRMDLVSISWPLLSGSRSAATVDRDDCKTVMIADGVKQVEAIMTALRTPARTVRSVVMA